MDIILILYVTAFILFILAAIPVPSRFGLGWFGLALCTLAQVVG